MARCRDWGSRPSRSRAVGVGLPAVPAHCRRMPPTARTHAGPWSPRQRQRNDPHQLLAVVSKRPRSRARTEHAPFVPDRLGEAIGFGTDVDPTTGYIGGSAACIAAVTGDWALEAFRTPLDLPNTSDEDTVNPPRKPSERQPGRRARCCFHERTASRRAPQPASGLLLRLSRDQERQSIIRLPRRRPSRSKARARRSGLGDLTRTSISRAAGVSPIVGAGI